MNDRRTSPAVSRIRALCEYIEQHAHEPLTLAALSRRAGLSPYHLQRSFKAVTGITPKQYHDNCRMKGFKSILRTSTRSDVTGAIFEAGYSSISRVYEKADTRLGMTPMEYRAGGKGVTITYVTTGTPLGLLMIGATDRGICFLQFGKSAEVLTRELEREYPNATRAPLSDPPSAEFRAWIDALNRHLEGSEPDIRLPLHVRATAFQLKVWAYLQGIPYGSVESYGEVARGIGEPSATRAVARACASNRTALLIPCHRVIRGTGALGGYRWGLDRKRVLLDSERRHRPDR